MHFLKYTLDTLFPPRCFSCAEMTGEHGNLCAECWKAIDFISAPQCVRCGMPFAHEMGGEVECMPCLQTPPPYGMARAVFAYNDASSRLVTGYKYHDRTQATPMFGRWLKRAGGKFLTETDVIVPVPLHRWRLLQRRYNQAALLAYALSRETGAPVAANALHRTRNTAQQAGLSREERLRNVKGAFTVSQRHAAKLAGKAVVLVDDVLTTGATLNACAQALTEAGAGTVYVLTLARTVLDNV